MRSAVALDYNPKLIVVVDTDDLDFADEVVSIDVVVDGISDAEIELKITFKSPPPQFDKTGFSV